MDIDFFVFCSTFLFRIKHENLATPTYFWLTDRKLQINRKQKRKSKLKLRQIVRYDSNIPKLP